MARRPKNLCFANQRGDKPGDREVAHQLRVPAADVVLGKTELPVLGNITRATYTGENG